MAATDQEAAIRYKLNDEFCMRQQQRTGESTTGDTQTIFHLIF